MEFLTVATQYCGMLEQCQTQSREELLDCLLRILPVLYWNAQVLPAMETMGQFLPDDQVTEADYEYVRGNARALLDDWDEYEDLVLDEASGRDECQWVSLSEKLADVYQPLRNFVWVYQQRLEQCMQDALWLCATVLNSIGGGKIWWTPCDGSTARSTHWTRKGTKTIFDKYDKEAINGLERALFQGRIEVVQSLYEAERAVKYLLSQPILGFDT